MPASKGSSRSRNRTRLICLQHLQAGSLPLAPPRFLGDTDSLISPRGTRGRSLGSGEPGGESGLETGLGAIRKGCSQPPM